MQLAQARPFEADAEDDAAAARRPARTPPAPPAPPAPRYGEARGPNLPMLALIALLHALGILALVRLDVIQVARPHHELKLFDISEPPPPPEQAPLPVTKIAPPVAVPPVAPPPIVVTPAPPPPVQTVREAPPPVIAPVAVPDPPKPAPAAGVPVSDRLSIVSRDPAPRYPLESRRKHEQGTVRLRVVVATTGDVKDISVASSSGYARLDEAALAAVRKWRFQAKVRDGVTIEAVGFIPIPFQLG